LYASTIPLKDKKVLNDKCWNKCKKVKASYTRYQALDPELIPVYRQWARRWLQVIHPAVGYHYFPPGLWLPSQSQSITALWLVLILLFHRW